SPFGPSGPAGPARPAGPCGPAGPRSPPGPTRPWPPASPCGPCGPTGPTGPGGPAGPIGPAGRAGPAGPIWSHSIARSLGEQLLLASITRSAPVVGKTQAWIMSPWALVPVMLSAHTAASANLWRTIIFSIEAPPCCLYSHAGFYRDKDARKAGVCAHLFFGRARGRGGHLRVPHLGIGAEIADQDHLVDVAGHDDLLLLRKVSPGRPRRAPPRSSAVPPSYPPHPYVVSFRAIPLMGLKIGLFGRRYLRGRVRVEFGKLGVHHFL